MITSNDIHRIINRQPTRTDRLIARLWRFWRYRQLRRKWGVVKDRLHFV